MNQFIKELSRRNVFRVALIYVFASWLLVQVADIMCCQEEVGFYLTAQHEEITEEMLDGLAVTTEQVEEVRSTLAEQVAEAESTLVG